MADNDPFGLKGRTAVITGAGGGLGRSHALLFRSASSARWSCAGCETRAPIFPTPLTLSIDSGSWCAPLPRPAGFTQRGCVRK